MHVRRSLRLCLAFLCLLLLSSTAHAGLFRAYLSVNGKDSNPCTVALPCRLLPAALAAVDDGGDVWIMDSANFNTETVAITKSVTILAVPGAIGSFVANGGDALVIFATGINVTLRNLVIRNLNGTGQSGISARIGNALLVEGCEIYGTFNGIYLFAPNSTVTVKNTTIHDTGGSAVVANGAMNVTIDGLTATYTFVGVEVDDGAHVTLVSSTVDASAFGIIVSAATTTLSVLVMSNSTITSAAGTGLRIYAVPPLTAEAFVQSSTIHANIGFEFLLSGGTEHIFSYGDNRLVFYQTGISGGSLTPISKI
jgi:hypothetical protein